MYLHYWIILDISEYVLPIIPNVSLTKRALSYKFKHQQVLPHALHLNGYTLSANLYGIKATPLPWKTLIICLFQESN